MNNLAQRSAMIAVLFMTISCLGGFSPTHGQAGIQIEEGILDSIRLAADPPSGDESVVIHPFDSSSADLGTGGEGGKPKRVEAARRIQQEGPEILSKAFVAKLSQLGTFTEVRDHGDAGIIVSGRFTILDPGSRAKRYFAGYGAGRGRMEIEGTVKDSSGNLLARFRQKRLTVMGVGGGEYNRKFRADCKRLGEDIAEFFDAWVKGKELR